ncbi:MAG TPA: aminoacyl-tRNA hydrolase [bacterium]|nr:aminoacyl-tRNA hydrolase [bacterium]HOL46745.1 aminoacyl-tRNA hydrolase [bacterium]HPQ18181.1 aminoacyl-tRNA hydrolase [bacterium]
MIRLFVGLGNYGKKYEKTRHNIGFMVIDSYLQKEKILKPFDKCSLYLLYKIPKEKNDIYLLKPLTYMNNSGIAIINILQKYNFQISEILIILDDFNLPFGQIRIRRSGSDGGHNGLKSIIYSLNTEKINRLRIGIGQPPENMISSEYVLSEFKNSEIKKLENIFITTNEIIDYLIENKIENGMNKFNNKIQD